MAAGSLVIASFVPKAPVLLVFVGVFHGFGAGVVISKSLSSCH
jgi:hypothetical protein